MLNQPLPQRSTPFGFFFWFFFQHFLFLFPLPSRRSECLTLTRSLSPANLILQSVTALRAGHGIILDASKRFPPPPLDVSSPFVARGVARHWRSFQRPAALRRALHGRPAARQAAGDRRASTQHRLHGLAAAMWRASSSPKAGGGWRPCSGWIRSLGGGVGGESVLRSKQSFNSVDIASVRVTALAR